MEYMKQSIPQRVYAGWQRYFEYEPWGPWRDNVHAGIIAREIRKMRGGKASVDDFMVRHPEERAESARTNLSTALMAGASKVSAAEAKSKLKAMRARAKKRKGKKP